MLPLTHSSDAAKRTNELEISSKETMHSFLSADEIDETLEYTPSNGSQVLVIRSHYLPSYPYSLRQFTRLSLSVPNENAQM
jgi:hypothetical protein